MSADRRVSPRAAVPVQPAGPPFAVTVTAGPPPGTPPMTPDATDAAARALGRIVGGAREAIRADGVRITVLDHWVGTHPDGAMIAVIIDAPDPATAVDAAVDLVDYALRANRRFTGWRITDPADTR
ncbi:hypothetical protein [Dactylosporangium sp. CA-139066]|uniref:hypothetical protein n=1 Tax=Dactylosporangium sp. CA-139066 TaxID=3239930 RepID=UPI003D8E128C